MSLPFLTGITLTNEIKKGKGPAALFLSSKNQFIRLIPILGNSELIQNLKNNVFL